MYTEDYTIDKLSEYFEKSTISLIKYSIIIYLCKYLDSFIFLINEDFVGIKLTYAYFEKSINKHNQDIIKTYNFNRISPSYDKISIKKVLYLMETFGFKDGYEFMKKDWIKNTHYSNYPKLWIAMINVYDVIHKLDKQSINDIINIKNKYIYIKNKISEKRINNLLIYNLKVYNNLWRFNIDMQEIIEDIFRTINENNKINIIGNLDVMNFNYDNLDLYHSIRDYINIHIYIIDNILYNKGYFVDISNTQWKNIFEIFFFIISIIIIMYSICLFSLYIYN